MGNQQERSLAWLGGILDGEGSISVQVYTLPDGRVRLTPFVAIVNSDLGILDKCETILRQIGVQYRYCNKPVSQGAIVGILKCQTLRIDGQKPVQKLLRVIGPYLWSSKRNNAIKVLEYLESRTKRGLQRNALGQVRRVEYSRSEIDLIASFRSSKRAKSSEAICQAPNVIG